MVTYSPIVVTASTTLSRARHTGAPVVVKAAAGLTLTLPPSTGSGVKFEIVIGTTVTSSNVVIQVANGSDVMAGVAWGTQDSGDTVNGWETASTSDTITLNGGSKGGYIGDRYVLQDMAANVWAVSGWAQQTGTEATPFSAAVS
jgi:hypothetical protein